MLKKLDQTRSKAIDELSSLSDLKGLEDWRIRHLGKKSALTQILRGLAELPLEERKAVGASANQVRALLEGHYGEKKENIRTALKG